MDSARTPLQPDIVAEEERLLARVLSSLAEGRDRPGQRERGDDQQLVSLRDEIAEARLEDVAALIAQMERVQGVSAQRAQAQGLLVDPASPYFAHLRLREELPGRGEVTRDVLIGNAGFVDLARGVRIVDWRNAPLSQLYYRYSEGSDYEETFADREITGVVEARRTLSIENGRIVRIACPAGVWTRGAHGWEHSAAHDSALAGGAGSATRPPQRGRLGSAPRRGQRTDRHLPEIAALIDPRQFELITGPDSGPVVIQGGAGSGKTTIGLHRIAYLINRAPERFSSKRILVVTHGPALASYMAHVLPALGVHGVKVITFADWIKHRLADGFAWLEAELVDDAPEAVTRLKSHPGLLHELEQRVRARNGKWHTRQMAELWADLVTDREVLQVLADQGNVEGAERQRPLTRDEILAAHRFISDRALAVTDFERLEQGGRRGRRASPPQARARLREAADVHDVLGGATEPQQPRRRRRAEIEDEADQLMRGATGVDGRPADDERPLLDVQDAAMLVRIQQLCGRGADRLDHLFVDEAQDLSPLQLRVLLGQTTLRRSVTLAGDTSQRLFLGNGFRDWRTVLNELELDHVAVEPLKLAYRSTRQILEFARHAMGELADPVPPEAPRSGAPVEAYLFPGTGAAVAFLAEALRDLAGREPRASVAVLARHAAQADRYHEGLRRAEVPGLRRVQGQDFSFRPGIDVTEIRQVKGLEFDYVVLVDVNAATFGRDEESRHLLHIGATRAAHQLWLLATGPASPLLPRALVHVGMP